MEQATMDSSNTGPGTWRRHWRKVLLAGTAGALALGGAAVMTPSLHAQAAATEPATVAGDPYAYGYADLAAKVLPAVVNVSVEGKVEALPTEGPGLPMPDDPQMREFLERFFGPGMPQREQRQQRVSGVGSGFVIDPDGWIVTNAHVAGGAASIKVTFQDGEEYPATLKGLDEKTDLALLKIEAGKKLPYVTFGDSSQVRVGDKVLAVGNPFGLGGTVTAGIVSATGRELGAGPYDDFLQVDAPINRGNSGGPTFNLKGEVIGVNSMIFSPSGGSVGIGFAISSNLAKQIIADLRDDGQVVRGWLGVQIQGMDEDLVASLGLPKAEGALVAGVEPDSPAAKAGIRRGDVILQFGEKPIAKVGTLTRSVAAVTPGQSVPVKLWRDGKEMTVTVAVGQMPGAGTQVAANEAPAAADQPRLGLVLAPIPPEARAELQLTPDQGGVLVRGVMPDGPAAAKGIREGDVILSVQDQTVRQPEDVQKAVRAAHQAGAKAVRMLVQRDGDPRYVAVPLAVS
jgi:serine protease Do